MTHNEKKSPSMREIVLVLTAMTVTTTVALYGIPTSLQSVLTLGTVQTDATSGPHGRVDTGSPVFALAEQVSYYVHASHVVHCDGTAIVPVADQRGYRILLQRDENRGHREFSNYTGWEFADIVLVPTGNLPAPPVSTIEWETAEAHAQMQPVYMGTGDGFHWYGNMTIGQQEELRTALNLKGGDDRFELLAQGVERATTRKERGQAIRHIAHSFGDEALPILLKEIQDSTHDTSGFAIHSLGMVNSEKSIEALLALYEGSATRSKAGAALASSFNPLAKPVYMDFLASDALEKPFFIPSIRSVIRHDWKDAIPLLEAIQSAPYTSTHFLEVAVALRELKGNPLPEALIEHQQIIRERCCGSHPDAVEISYAALLEHPDTNGVLLMAIKLATADGKGSRRPSEMGIEMLKTLPRTLVLPTLEHLKTAISETRSRDLLSDIYHEVKGLDTRNIALRNSTDPIG